MGLVIHFLSFQKEFKKLNNTEARMLEFYLSHGITFFLHENAKILSYFTQRYNGRHDVTLQNL